MALKNLQMFQPYRDMLYRHRPATPLRAPPSALSRNLSKSAETLVATTRCGKELKSRKARSTEQPGVGYKASSPNLPALVKTWPGDDISLKSRSRNGSGSSRAASLDRSTRASSTTLNSDEDNINVVIRVRPVSEQERSHGEREVLEFPGKGQVICPGTAAGQKHKVFSYNVVFEPAASQEDVLEYSGVKRLLEMAVEGFSCTVFCYGQTGSGKTHTLTGPPGLVEKGSSPYSAEHGLIVRSFVYLFQLIRNRPDCNFVLKSSFLEIYNEKVIDLLNPGTSRKPLQVRWSKESRSFYVENLFTVDCEELDDLFAVLEEGYCIAQLSDGKKRGHIPYRDSKLTKLLADSLAGNGVTLMIACIAPTRSNLSETVNTLRYAARAKKIKSKPIVKMDARDALILSLKREVEVLQVENQHLRTALHVQIDYTMDNLNHKNPITPRIETNKLYQLPQSELVELLQLHMQESAALRQENSELFTMRDQLLRDHELISRENERLLKKLEDVNYVCVRSPIIPARPTYSDASTKEPDIWTNPSTSSGNSVVSGGN